MRSLLYYREIILNIPANVAVEKLSEMASANVYIEPHHVPIHFYEIHVYDLSNKYFITILLRPIEHNKSSISINAKHSHTNDYVIATSVSLITIVLIAVLIITGQSFIATLILIIVLYLLILWMRHILNNEIQSKIELSNLVIAELT